jgi:chorismate dehydratase
MNHASQEPSPILRVGMIDYVNGLVPDYDFCSERFEKVYGVPSVLNSMLSEGKLDLSPVSSMEFLLRPDLYKVISDVCIASFGRTHTVGVFSPYPPKAWEGKRFCLTGASLTSVHLFKVICEVYLKIEVVTETRNLQPLGTQDLLALQKKYDGVLLIGDEVRLAASVMTFPYHDLGSLWAQLTGLPFVYALWLVRKDSCKFFKDEISCVVTQLRASISQGLANLSNLYRNSSISWKQEEFFRYFQECIVYRLSERELLGFERFQEDLLSLGVIPKLIPLNYF